MWFLFFFLVRQPPFGQASSFTRFIHHTKRRITVGRSLWTSDQLVAQNSTWQHTTINRHTSISLVGLEPTISAGERLQTYVFECRKFFRMNAVILVSNLEVHLATTKSQYIYMNLKTLFFAIWIVYVWSELMPGDL